MSRSPASSRSRTASFDEAGQARELEDFFGQHDPVDVAAAHWHTCWEQGLTAQQEAELQQWLAASPAHAAAFARMGQGVAELRSMPAQAVAQVRDRVRSGGAAPPQGLGRRPSRPRPSSWGVRLASAWGGLLPRPALLAFCCVAFLALGMGWYQWLQQPTFAAGYVAERAQRKVVTLPDGSELAMDADTQAQVMLYRDRREVRITHGQIMFAVTADSARPFHVLAGAARVSVVGTRFSVRYRSVGMDAGAVAVAVEQGHVRVAGLDAQAGSGAMAPVDLMAGQGLRVSPEGVPGQVAAVAPSSIALWRKGLIRFENTTLADALLELERYGPTGLVIANPAVAAMTIGGSYQVGHPGEFARMVAQILPVRLVAGPAGSTEIAAMP